MNIRQSLYFSVVALRGQKLGKYYRSFLNEDNNGIPIDTTKNLLIRMLAHCRRSVPYYSRIIDEADDSFYEDPMSFLRGFPILKKEDIRNHFNDLKSKDLSHRKWYINTTGGSTGEPVQFIQDWDYAAHSGAITSLFSKLAGREEGELQVNLWGSMRDIVRTKKNWRGRLINKLTNTVLLDVFRMSPEQVRDYIFFLNLKRPKLILAYANAIYDLAKYAESEKVNVLPQNSIMTSAMALYPTMREVIERVFKCRIYNRYGSRELGDIACERPGIVGLWVAPWGNYVEIVDDHGNRVPDGQEGEILVTSLTNYAMPLIRYEIRDRGYILPKDKCNQAIFGQVLGNVTGRASDSFRTKDGTIIDTGYFEVLLYFREWIKKYQVIQRNYSHVVYKFVKSNSEFDPTELDEIRAKTQVVVGSDCKVDFEFVDEIGETDSGKYRYFISEMPS